MKNGVRPISLISLLLLLVFTLSSCGGNQTKQEAQNTFSSSSRAISSSINSSSSSSTSTEHKIFPADVSTVRIMIAGDSISAGPGCYKKYLDEHLQNANVRDYEFVGSYSDDCPGGNIRHSAVSCSTAFNYTQASFTLPNCFSGQTFQGLNSLMSANTPDLVMIQLGVNDIWGGNTPVESVLNNYQTLVTQMRAHNPNVVIALAQIHKVITDRCVNQAAFTNAENLVKALPAWAQSRSTEQSPIFVADLWSNSDPYDANDCVHPDDVGARKMAQNWFDALEPILVKPE